MKPISTDMENIFCSVQLREDEYLDETSNLIHCSRCRTPRQKRFEMNGKQFEPRCMCACQTEAYEQRELAKRIAQLSEDIEELRSEKAMILSRFDKTDDEGMKEVKQWVASMESSLKRLEQTEAKYQAELDAALAQFQELAGEAEGMDKEELHAHRQILRKPNTQDARDKLQQAHGKQYSAITMIEAQQDVDHLLREDERKLEPPVQKRPARHQPEPQKKQLKRDYER